MIATSNVYTLLTISTEMPRIEQLLDAHIHHLCPRDRAHCSIKANVGSSSCPDKCDFRDYEDTNGGHEEL